MPPAPTLPVAQDAGLFVTTAEVQSYAYQVDGLIHAINRRVLDRADADVSAVPLPIWMKWVAFKVEWEAVFSPLKVPGWFTSGSDFDKVRGYHLEALRWVDRWKDCGVSFEGVALPQPPSYTGPELPDASDVAFGAGAALAVGGALLLAIYFVGRG